MVEKGCLWHDRQETDRSRDKGQPGVAHIPATLALRELRKEDCRKFEASLDHTVSSRTTLTTLQDTIPKIKRSRMDPSRTYPQAHSSLGIRLHLPAVCLTVYSSGLVPMTQSPPQSPTHEHEPSGKHLDTNHTSSNQILNLNSFIFTFSPSTPNRIGAQTHGFVHSKQPLYHWGTSLAPRVTSDTESKRQAGRVNTDFLFDECPWLITEQGIKGPVVWLAGGQLFTEPSKMQ